jgi:DNA-binding beta-propeller fold protein YncE
MTRRMLGSALLACAAMTAAAAPAAGADGLPVPEAVPPNGPLSDGQSHYLTRSTGGSTSVSRSENGSGRVSASTSLPGSFTAPVVALDGSPGGLSADGGTLALIRPRASIPQTTTRIAVLDSRNLPLHDVITLRGDFSFDAISPDGSRLYLIEYLSPSDPTQYAVRAYDVGAERLLRHPIVDPDEEAGEMRGFPLTRAASPDGRWAYTLYDGAGKEPFVHALDTVAGRAVCIDMPILEDFSFNRLHRLELAVNPDGSALDVVDRKTPVATVDASTFEVSTPSEAADSVGGGLPWSAIVAATALAALVAAASLIARRRHREPVAGDVT